MQAPKSRPPFGPRPLSRRAPLAIAFVIALAAVGGPLAVEWWMLQHNPPAVADDEGGPQPPAAPPLATATTATTAVTAPPGATPPAALPAAAQADAGRADAAPGGASTVAEAAAAPVAADTAAMAARDALLAWAAAWSKRDFRAYQAAYTEDFKGNQPTRDDWLRQRESRIVPRRAIEVRLSDIVVSTRDGRAVIDFQQHYSSDGIKDSTYRRVRMIQQGPRWLISEESDR